MNPRLHGNVAQDATIQMVGADTAVELDQYDPLPERWRRLIDELPVKQSVGAVLNYIRGLGDDGAYVAVISTFEQRFPGWRSSTTCPTPTRTLSRRSRRSSDRWPYGTRPQS